MGNEPTERAARDEKEQEAKYVVSQLSWALLTTRSPSAPADSRCPR